MRRVSRNPMGTGTEQRVAVTPRMRRVSRNVDHEKCVFGNDVTPRMRRVSRNDSVGGFDSFA